MRVGLRPNILIKCLGLRHGRFVSKISGPSGYLLGPSIHLPKGVLIKDGRSEKLVA